MKSRQRKEALALRRSLTEEERRDLSRVICGRILKLPEIADSKIILSYLSTWDEVNLEALHKKLREQGKILAYPLSADEGQMEAYVPLRDEAFEEGRYGIKSPVVSLSQHIEPEDIDLVLVPCVAFDEKLCRLGHGAGYYDRYLPRCKKARFVTAAFEAQKLDEVITDKYDRRMDAAVTEKQIYKAL